MIYGPMNVKHVISNILYIESTATASCKMGTGSLPGVKCGRAVPLTTHPLLVPRS